MCGCVPSLAFCSALISASHVVSRLWNAVLSSNTAQETHGHPVDEERARSVRFVLSCAMRMKYFPGTEVKEGQNDTHPHTTSTMQVAPTFLAASGLDRRQLTAGGRPAPTALHMDHHEALS